MNNFLNFFKKHFLFFIEFIKQYIQKLILKKNKKSLFIIIGISSLILTVFLIFFLKYKNKTDIESEKDTKENTPGFVQISEESVKISNIKTKPLSSGSIMTELEANGEISPDENKLSHIKPQVSGIVSEVLVNIGETVKEGDILAVIISPDLGKAKIDYFSAKQNLDLAKIDFDREKEVYDNTVKLLDALKSDNESNDAIKSNFGSIGENKSKLLSAYAAKRQAKTAQERAVKLLNREAVSKASAELAIKDYESAEANFKGIFEDINFSHKARYIQAERAMQVAETSYRNAKRYLYILGLSEKDISKMASEKDENIAKFTLKSPRNGTIIEKHISIGERIKDEVDYPDCFVIADLSSVQVNIGIYASDINLLKPMQLAKIEVSGLENKYSGKVQSITPTVSDKTRTAVAKIILENPDGKLKPGLFASAKILIEEIKCPLIIPKDAVQNIDGQNVVFADTGNNKFTIHPVIIGAKDSKSYEIKNGINEGTPVVVENAFSLRTEFEKAKLDAD